MFEGNPPNGWADACQPTQADISLNLQDSWPHDAATVAVATVSGAV